MLPSGRPRDRCRPSASCCAWNWTASSARAPRRCSRPIGQRHGCWSSSMTRRQWSWTKRLKRRAKVYAARLPGVAARKGRGSRRRRRSGVEPSALTVALAGQQSREDYYALTLIRCEPIRVGWSRCCRRALTRCSRAPGRRRAPEQQSRRPRESCRHPVSCRPQPRGHRRAASAARYPQRHQRRVHLRVCQAG